MSDSETLNFNWEPVPNAVSYKIELFQKADNADKLILADEVNTNQFSIKDLNVLDEGKFKWQIRAKVRSTEGKDYFSPIAVEYFTIALKASPNAARKLFHRVNNILIRNFKEDRIEKKIYLSWRFYFHLLWLMVFYSQASNQNGSKTVIQWKSVENASSYKLEIRPRKDKQIQLNLKENEALFGLKTGKYEYRVGALNKFKKVKHWSKWYLLMVYS